MTDGIPEQNNNISLPEEVTKGGIKFTPGGGVWPAAVAVCNGLKKKKKKGVSDCKVVITPLLLLLPAQQQQPQKQKSNGRRRQQQQQQKRSGKKENGLKSVRKQNGICKSTPHPLSRHKLEGCIHIRSGHTDRRKQQSHKPTLLQKSCKVGGGEQWKKQQQRVLLTGKKVTATGSKVKTEVKVNSKALSEDIVLKPTYEGLMLSLQSPLPNEHELALGTILKLSAIGEKVNQEVALLERNPAILRLLLAHAGFYQDCGLRAVMGETFEGAFGLNFAKFWGELCEINGELLKLLCECYPGKLAKMTEVDKGALLGRISKEDEDDGQGDHRIADQEIENLKCCSGCPAIADILAKMDVGCDWNLPFPLRMSSGLFGEKLERRVHLIGTILRNFSFQSEDAKIMARSPVMLRFLLVMAQIDHETFPKIAFDIISNISKYMTTSEGYFRSEESQQLVTSVVNLLVTTVLSSSDRFKIHRGLEALQGVTTAEDESFRLLVMVINKEVISRVIELLSMKQDAFFVIACLETLLAMSETGMESCEEIAQVQGSISLLICFLTMDFTDADVAISTSRSNTKGRHQENQHKKVSHVTPVPAPSSSSETASTAQNTSAATSDFKHCQKTELARSDPSSECGLSNDELLERIATHVKSNHVQAKDFMLEGSYYNNCPWKQEIKLFNVSRQGAIDATNLSSNDIAQLSPLNGQVHVVSHPYVCSWEGCNSSAITKGWLRHHVYEAHCADLETGRCRWEVENQTPKQTLACSLQRGKFSLVSHLESRHYNDEALEMALTIRRYGIQPPLFPPSPNLLAKDEGNASDGAKNPYAMVVSSYPLPTNEPVQEKNENAVTKSVRLTAALTLRNLAKYSALARRLLALHEPHLVDIASREYDCSGFVAKILRCMSLGKFQDAV